jgi:parallel beta-helix repeat protein
MKNKIYILFIGIFFFIGLIFNPIINAQFDVETPKIINLCKGNNSSIYIDGNDEFTFENGVSGGSGTENDPYIIENWNIVDDGSTNAGLFINNTDAYFVIRNCSVSNYSDYYEDGIRLNNVENGRIEDSQVYNNDFGIGVYDSNDIIINNCIGYNNTGVEGAWWSSGITCWNSNNIKITSYEGFNNEYSGIYFQDVSYSVIEDSICYSNHNYGIIIKGEEPHNIVKNCKFFNNTFHGIRLGNTGEKYSAYHEVYDCESYGNRNGITLHLMEDVIVENCSFQNNIHGIEIGSSSNNIIKNCKIFNSYDSNNSEMGMGIIVLGGIGPARSFNNLITNCDIIDNDVGISLWRSLNTKVYRNNILNNKYYGLDLVLLATSSIKWNNIYGNGYYWENFTNNSLYMRFGCLIDGRNNYWGAEDGPSSFLSDKEYNLYPIHKGSGTSIYFYRSIPFIRPWATEPIPDAGVN